MLKYRDDSALYECVKEITKTLRASFKGIASHTYGYCCGSDYDAYHKDTNYDDYVDAKIYKGGLNNCFTKYGVELGDTVYFMWNLTKFSQEAVREVMANVATKHGFVVNWPEDDSKCIKVGVDKSE